MSTADDLKTILGHADLDLDGSKRSTMLRRLNVDPRWSISDENFAAVGAALTLLAERVDELEAKLAARGE